MRTAGLQQNDMPALLQRKRCTQPTCTSTHASQHVRCSCGTSSQCRSWRWWRAQGLRQGEAARLSAWAEEAQVAAASHRLLRSAAACGPLYCSMHARHELPTSLGQTNGAQLSTRTYRNHACHSQLRLQRLLTSAFSGAWVPGRAVPQSSRLSLAGVLLLQPPASHRLPPASRLPAPPPLLQRAQLPALPLQLLLLQAPSPALPLQWLQAPPPAWRLRGMQRRWPACQLQLWAWLPASLLLMQLPALLRAAAWQCCCSCWRSQCARLPCCQSTPVRPLRRAVAQHQLQLAPA